MNPRIINQGDPQWSELAYRDLPYTVVKEGCGLCAVTMCAMELTKYWNYTPKDTIGFMRAYATNGNGTLWEGIRQGLKKYLGNYIEHYNMASFFEELNKGNRIGIILFGSNTSPDGTQWTKSGHYVMFNQYKVENGKHWFYTKDSSWRHIDGWHSYEDSMRGCIPSVMWTAEIPKGGWRKENGYWYYYEDGKMMKNKWAKDSSGDWYYVGSDGKMVTNEWAQDKTKKWFYLGKDGKMVKSTWVKWKNVWYYLGVDGAMVTNKWVKDKKGWCYLGKDGKQVKDAWIRWGSYDYYVKPDGYMATGTMNVKCKFDKDGKLVATV